MPPPVTSAGPSPSATAPAISASTAEIQWAAPDHRLLIIDD
jgi:hypothetical protein